MDICEIVIVSGKGGTGKTTITSSLAALAAGKAMLCDTDVDAPDLWLLLSPEKQEEKVFMGMDGSEIDSAKCIGCGKCLDFCRFNAIKMGNGKAKVLEDKCEGCGGCVMVCPTGAASLVPRKQGSWFSAETEFGPLIYARLNPGGDNSGMLVSTLRTEAKKKAKELKLPIIIVDGPPGVACPAISSLTGASLAIAITEPTNSGIHDLKRLAKLTADLEVPLGVVLNKSDLTQFKSVESVCADMGIPFMGQIPFRKEIPKAISQGKPPLKELSPEIEIIWKNIMEFAAEKTSKK